MEFKGRQELVENCEDCILGLRAKFIDEGIKFCRQLTLVVPHEQMKICLESIFDALLIQKPNATQIRDDLNSLIPKLNAKDELINFLLLNLTLNFSHACDDAVYVGYFVNAVSRLKEILYNAENHQETTVKEMIDTGSFFYEDPINTFTRMKNAKVRPEFNSFFSKQLRADIIDYNIADKSVTLSNFSRTATMHANKRKFQRVLPNRFTKISLKGEQGELVGSLYDISEGGISILSSQATNFKDGEELEANFDILLSPDEVKNVSLKLKLVTELAYKGYIRYCMQLVDDDKTIKDFTQKRVKETLDELRSRINLYE